MTKTHQLNKGAMKVHLAHQRNSRTATAAHAAAKGRACQACDGRKRKHTCGRARTSRPAAPHAAGATASRLGSEAAAAAVGRDMRMHIIAQGDEAAQGFFDPEQCARNARAAAAADRAAAKFVAAEPAVARGAEPPVYFGPTDSPRAGNRIMRLELLLTFGTASLAFCAAIAGFFGMHRHSASNPPSDPMKPPA